MLGIEKITSSRCGSMVSNMDLSKTGYTNDMFQLQTDIRMYAKFIAVMVRLELVTVRTGQVLASNYGQKRFETLRDGGFLNGPTI